MINRWAVVVLGACAIASLGSGCDSGTVDGDAGTSAIAECEALATTFESNCAGSDPRPCIWAAYRALCRTGNTEVLLDSMRCLDATQCRSFADPNDGEPCLSLIHGADLPVPTAVLIEEACTDCGGANCEAWTSPTMAVPGNTEILPFLSSADVAAVSSCRGTECTIDGIIGACGSVPAIAAFASCVP